MPRSNNRAPHNVRTTRKHSTYERTQLARAKTVSEALKAALERPTMFIDEPDMIFGMTKTGS
jgi:hypothetical protein